MHEYYRKNAPKLKKGMNGFLMLIAGELEEKSGKPYAEVFEEICRIVPEREYLFVDHGNPYYHCAANTYLQQSFDKKGYKNVKVIQLKERDSFGQAVAFLKERKADETNAQVVIIPLIIAWGDYMANELYNAQDSFMWKLRNAGYRTVFTGAGMGEFENFRQVYNAVKN